MQKLLTEIINQSKQPDNLLPPQLRTTKLMEEVGEFAETVLIAHGYLKHKNPKERPEGEAADVVICTLDTLAGVYPELSSERIVEMLDKQLRLKASKWARVTAEANNKPTDPCPGCRPGIVCRTPACGRLKPENRGKY